MIKLIPAEHDDKWWIWENRNAEFIRKRSANQQAISRESHATWWSLHSKQGRHIYLIVDDCERIGAVILKKNPSAKPSVDLSLWLVQTQTGKGIGKQVLDLCEKEVKDLGRSIIEACVMDHNYPSLVMFIKHGYKIVGHEPIPNTMTGDLNNIYYLEKPLC